MAIDLQKFTGVLPYSSELFGVFQPILGWKSKLKKTRMLDHSAELVELTVDKFLSKGPPLRDILKKPVPIGPDDLDLSQMPKSLKTQSMEKIRDATIKFIRSKHREPEDKDWKQIINDADLPKAVSDIASEYKGKATKRKLSGIAVRKELAVAGTLIHLSETSPQTLKFMVGKILNSSLLQSILPDYDPLSKFDPESQQAVLSPIGIVDLYREYFFEFDSLLGPAVGHVWVSPGSTLELFEIHTRKTIQEKQVEAAIEMSTKTETGIVDQDELSTAVSEENSRNIKFGISASGGVNFGNSNVATIQASATARFGMEFNLKKSQEVAHKHTRRQSDRLSNEIKRNYKTTFRTSVETTDTSSRRYVVQNSTEKLVNFELKRKMRQVGVQVQHVGTQLCWQVYVDQPGYPLGISELVHVAQPDEFYGEPQQPDALEPLPTKKQAFNYSFHFEPVTESARNDGGNETYVEGVDEAEKDETGEDQGRINWKKELTGELPGKGYILDDVEITDFTRSGDGDMSDDFVCIPATEIVDKVAGKFNLVLKTVNFDYESFIAFALSLTWIPPEPSEEDKKKQKEKEEEFNEHKRQLQHAAAIKLVRERIKLASNVEMRPSKDLREEERTIIYRNLIKMLTNIKSISWKQYHLKAELIRTIFDIDNMLYFVAPEWWLPQIWSVTRQQVAPPGNRYKLTSEDKVSWGGRKVKGTLFGNAQRPNYLITEESEPARMGSSLGWLLQLDGDPHRNAFLNSPWVRAVIPIRPGRELAAINWLKLAEVEGVEGLDSKYGGNDPDLEPKPKTIEDALEVLAKKISAVNTDVSSSVATEIVYETGFDPLEGGFRVVGEPLKIFDQWIEILPTDQLVAVEYEINK